MGIKERKEREREQRRLDILDSARSAFVKHGLTHTTMDKIADEAELAKGTLYLYYRNRDELLMALVADDMEVLIKKMDTVANGRQHADVKLYKAVETFHRFAKSNEFFYKAITHVNMTEMLNCRSGESPAIDQFRDLNERMMSSMKRIIEDGVKEGTFFIDKPAEYIVVQIVLALKGTIMLLSNGMVPPEWIKHPIDKIMMDQIHLFTRGLTGPLTSKKNIQSVKA